VSIVDHDGQTNEAAGDHYSPTASDPDPCLREALAMSNPKSCATIQQLALLTGVSTVSIRNALSAVDCDRDAEVNQSIVRDLRRVQDAVKSVDGIYLVGELAKLAK
jgi:hypothetical protein